MITGTQRPAQTGRRLKALLAFGLMNFLFNNGQLQAQTAAISGDAAICTGSSTNLTIDFTGTGPFTYSYSNGTSTLGPFVTSNDPETVPVSPVTATTYTLVSMSDATGPGTVSGSAAITVDAAPPVGSITSAGFIVPPAGCNGGTGAVSCNAVPGATGYTWTVTPGTLINGNSSPFTTTTPSAILTFGPLPAGTSSYEVCVFASNACGVSSAKCKKIRGTVSAPGPISGNAVACGGTSGNYSTTAVAGAVTYNWTATGGIIINSGNGTTSVNVTFPSGFTQGSLCVNGALVCGTTGANRCLNIASGAAHLAAFTGGFSVCPGQTGVLYVVPANATVTTYTWTPPANATISSGQGNDSVTVDFGAGFTGGQLCVTGTTACGTTTAARCKYVASGTPSTPQNIIGQLGGVCGSTITYSIPPVGGATSYNWVVPATATLVTGQGTASIDVSFPVGFTGGQICVTAENSCGSSPSRCAILEGIPADPDSISGPVLICDAGVGLIYSTASVPGATNYVWNVPAGATITSGAGTNSITVDWGTSSGLVTVSTENACGQSGTETLNVIFGITPATPGPITGPEYICTPQTGVVYYINAVAGAQGYLWYFSGTQGGATFSSPTNDTLVTVDFAPSSNSTYKLRVIALNSTCGDSPFSGIQLRQDISVPLSSGPDFVCAGDSGVYSVTSPVAGAASYTWTAPAGATIDGNPSPFNTSNLSVTVAFPVGFVSGDVCVAGIDPCGNATADRCITVQSTPSKPGKVFGAGKVCPTVAGVMYYTNPVPGAASYTWTVPANATIASGQGNDTIFVDFAGFTPGDICVTADNSCGSSPSECKTILLNLPATPGNIQGPLSGLCGGTFNYTVPNVAGVTYDWTLPAGAVITTGAGTNSVTIDFSGVTFPTQANQYLSLCVNATNTCATSADRCANIKGVPADPGSITGPASVCANQTGVDYSIAAVNGATSYLWTVPAGASVVTGSGTTAITVDFGSNAGSVGVRAENACGTSGTRTLGVAMPCRFISGEAIGLNVFPNPAVSEMNVIFTLDRNSMVELMITDLAGKAVSVSKVKVTEGFNDLKLDVSGLSKGLYMLNIKDAAGMLGNVRIAVQ
jgi:hypothetical protein